MSKLNLILSLAAVAVVAFLVGYVVGSSSKKEEPVVSTDAAANLPTVALGIQHCPSKGPEHAKATIIEFTDYQ